jgi:uracil-DNA glycosylase family 4
MNDNVLNDLIIFLKGKGSVLIPVTRGVDEALFLSDFSLKAAAPVSAGPSRTLTLREQIESCDRCGPVSERRYPAGTGSNRVMLILNAPRLLSRFEREHYKKESIEMLKKMLGLLGLNIADTYITSMIKCEITDTLSGPGRAAASCADILKREIETISPEIIIVFGDIIPVRTLVKETRGVDWFSIEHPITLIRNPDLKRGAWNTLKTVQARISGTEINQ